MTLKKLTYIQVGDYFIPSLVLTDQPNKPIGMYGHLRKQYLQKYRPMLYTNLLLEGKLYHHLQDVDEAANLRMDVLMPQYMEAAGVTEKLKAADPMKWVGLMNSCKSQVE